MNQGQPPIRHILSSDGDITEQSIHRPAGADAAVDAIMTPAPFCVRVDVSVAQVIALLLEREMSAVPVVDADGRPIGLVSKTDLLAHRDDGDDVVRRVMTPVLLSVRRNVSIGRAIALMATERVHHLAITDHVGRIVGILSALDVVQWIAQLYERH
jgi:predicted transcriptional regulator